jgi:Tol biopolymer transport system component
MTPRHSPNGKWVAFSRAASDTATDIWIAPLEGGGEARQITFDQRPKRELRWAPDGKGVIYRMRFGAWGYWYAPIDATPGAQPRRVITPESVSGTFDVRANAKGGWTLALAHYYQTESIWRAEIPGANASPAIPARFISFGFGGIDVNPVFSPDNLHVAFISTRSNAPEIWVADNAGMSARQVTSFAGPQISIPCWSPDGKWLVASSRFNGDGEMFLVEAAGGSPVRVLERRGIEDTEPQFSPDGKWISFASVVKNDHQLFRMPVPAPGATKAPPAEQLTTNGGVVHRYSPDGKWIYFVKDDHPGLFRIPAAGGKEELVVDRVRTDLYRGWAIGRRSLYYTALDAAGNKPVIYRVDPATGSHERICAPDKPFPRWTGTLSVSRDESWMIFPQHEAEGARLLWVEDARLA